MEKRMENEKNQRTERFNLQFNKLACLIERTECFYWAKSNQRSIGGCSRGKRNRQVRSQQQGRTRTTKVNVMRTRNQGDKGRPSRRNTRNFDTFRERATGRKSGKVKKTRHKIENVEVYEAAAG